MSSARNDPAFAEGLEAAADASRCPAERRPSPDRTLRILYYVEALDIGGSHQTTVTTAVAMRSRGHRVFLASLDGPLRERLSAGGVTHVPVETRVCHPSLRAARSLAEVVGRERIDVVCPNGEDCVLDALLASIPRGVPVIPTFGGMQNPEYSHPRVPKALIFSGEYRDVLIRRFGWKSESLELLINRIDTNRFRPGLDGSAFRRRWELGQDSPLVLMACRLDSLKIGGVHFLLDAVGELGARVPSVRVVVAGSGALRSEITGRVAEINRLERCQRVILPGKVMEMELALAASDVVIGNGARSGLEGLACGKPVVSVGESGLAGVLSPENIEHFAYYNFDKGRVFDGTTRKDASALAETLADLLLAGDRRARLSEFGRDYAVRRLSIEAGIDRLEAILLSAEPRRPLQRIGDAWELGRSVCSYGWYALRRKLRRWLMEGGRP